MFQLIKSFFPDAHAYIFPDNAYATLQITGVQYDIDWDLIQSKLCQTCLDSINSLWFTTQPPAEYAVVSFEEKTIQPLLNAYPWFSAGNYGIDCEFKENGAVDILVHYCPNRYLSLLAWRKTQTLQNGVETVDMRKRLCNISNLLR